MRTKKRPEAISEKQLALYEQLVKTIPNLERKGKTMPYTSLNGHMFSFLDKESKLSLRLPDEKRTAFMKAYNAPLSVQHGRVMKEYVIVPDELLDNLEELRVYFESSYTYVKSLKPKPTGKKK